MTEATTRRYSGQSADERTASRRARLLDASFELFGTQGFAATTVERICTAAKVSTRHFYQLHENKEAAFLDVFEQILGTSVDHALGSLATTTGRPMRERVPPALLAYVGPMIEDARAARIAFVELVGASSRVEARRLEFRETLVRLVEHEAAPAVERGEVTPRDFRFATLALVGAANAIIYDWVQRTDRPSVDSLEAGLADLAVTLLVD